MGSAPKFELACVGVASNTIPFRVLHFSGEKFRLSF